MNVIPQLFCAKRVDSLSDEILKVRLFGRFGAWIGDDRILGLHRREGERLLAYLILHEGEPVSYRTLAQIFWPSEAVPGAVDYATFPSTRQAVHYLRLALGPHAHRLKTAGRGLILLDMRDTDVDVLEFDRIVRHNRLEEFPRAAAIQCVPLLEEWQDAWVVEARAVRQRSQRRIVSAIQEAPPSVTAAYIPPAVRADSSILQETPGGAMLLNSPFYIERDADQKFIAAISAHPSTVLVKADAWMGKSSLLARGLHEARQTGSAVALTDFQAFSSEQFESSSALFLAIAASLAIQLNIDVDPASQWRPHLGPGTNLEQFVRKHVLGSFDEPLVWGMDGVDQLFMHACSNELFGLLRSWHNRRAMDPAGPWLRLTIVLAYATEAALFIADQSQSPFNVGVQVSLTDFTLEQVRALNTRSGSPLTSDAEVSEIYALLQGHPFLTRRALQALSSGEYTLNSLIASAASPDGPFANDLRKLATPHLADEELATSLRKIVSGENCGSRLGFYRLRSGGLVRGEWNVNEEIRCPLYRSYLKSVIE